MADVQDQVQLPMQDRQLMACRECKRVLTRAQFVSDGCASCGSTGMHRDELQEQTTAKFHGFVGLVDAHNSWVARLIGREDAPPGVYAAHVAAEEPEGLDDDGDGARDDMDGEDANVGVDDVEALLGLE
mmetsp:Transcript_31942/g.98915  ORF Transcript_31942/g.98915 Transcript_31942/m.98915 type:complete len:129 (-) Transcript_31942:24-410(-)|eukprot:CAMPEP_0174831930 /NCGR_PEP_ID=MMETSP1114-20130205/3390_1 /TAXON_ID=312471 /ORGANISM="Neobodo designis, Strain CCAP 1951/1" /LENGTH=128 /DNA_ID=CAMNT_0016065777 /DNA_START=24 /DNA_END=410 /DNA_ORIENTATION=-